MAIAEIRAAKEVKKKNTSGSILLVQARGGHTHRDNREGCVDHPCSDGCIDRLLHSGFFKDSCRIIEYLVGERRGILWRADH